MISMNIIHTAFFMSVAGRPLTHPIMNLEAASSRTRPRLAVLLQGLDSIDAGRPPHYSTYM